MKSTLLFAAVCGIALAGCQQNANDTSQSPNSNPPAYNAAGPSDEYSGANSNLNSTPSNSSMTGNSTNQPDNTGINTRDKSPDAVTAQNQGESQSDINLTSQIRQRVMGGNMSFNAQNVKIITLNGHVMLRGPVNTQDEKDTIGKMAGDIAGQTNVDNQLEVKP